VARVRTSEAGFFVVLVDIHHLDILLVAERFCVKEGDGIVSISKPSGCARL